MTRNCGNCFQKSIQKFCRHKEISCWTGEEPKAEAPVKKIIPDVNYQIVRQALAQMSNFPPDRHWVSTFSEMCAAIRGELES